jgi:hypothetical protein
MNDLPEETVLTSLAESSTVPAGTEKTDNPATLPQSPMSPTNSSTLACQPSGTSMEESPDQEVPDDPHTGQEAKEVADDALIVQRALDEYAASIEKTLGELENIITYVMDPSNRPGTEENRNRRNRKIYINCQVLLGKIEGVQKNVYKTLVVSGAFETSQEIRSQMILWFAKLACWTKDVARLYRAALAAMSLESRGRLFIEEGSSYFKLL